MITQEKISLRVYLGIIWVLSELEHSATKTDVLKREFPICDVAGGQIGKPSIFFKRESPTLEL